ncbi:MAG TPA: radical SAM protein [Bacteroidota bacterium]|nr:radical SAM protein [Bacteroidota bacterium]
MTFVPSYIALEHTGELRRRARALEAMLGSCTLCPHDCGNDRLRGDIARCYSGYLPIVSAYTAHFGEEPALVGTHGVGNIFFGNCNLRCVYCQNYQISQNFRSERRNEVTLDRLAAMMIELQEKGCHSIGLVSPTHFAAQIVLALELAVARGLHLPLIYNTNAFDALPVLRLLDGVVDIYLPDLKYSDDDMGYQYSKINNYTAHARAAVAEMHRQVGSHPLFGEDGLVKRGLIIRHLVLPNDIAGSRETLQWIRDTLGPDVWLSVMSQYFPTHKASAHPLLDRKVRSGEYDKVLSLLERYGLDNGWAQDFEAAEYYRPEFEDPEQPFKGLADNDVEEPTKQGVQ